MPDEHAGLQLETDRGFQERLWTFQRVFWIMMLLFTIAALAGATGGGGKLAKGQVRGEAASINYPRVSRWQREEQMEISLSPASAVESEVLLGEDLLQAFSVSNINPAPKSAKVTGEGLSLVIERVAGESGKIAFTLKPEKPALPREFAVRIDDDRLPLTIAVLP